MYRLSTKEEALLDNLYFDCSFLTFQETQEALVELCEKHKYGLVETLGSQYTAFYLSVQLPAYKGKAKHVGAILEWNRNKGDAYLELSWTQDSVEAYLSSKRAGKDMYEKIMQSLVGKLLTEWSLKV
jgi:hypothetical protein